MKMGNISQHNEEIHKNLAAWEKKPALREIYRSFHQLIAKHLSTIANAHTVELGSGIGKIKEVIPDCITTDLFPNPWIDRVENAYKLSFSDSTVSNLILFDIFHHLRYPGTALNEFRRVLTPGGRILVFGPYISVLGRIIFGLFHHEPLGLKKDIQLFAPKDWSPEDDSYYAATGNATRIFFGKKYLSFQPNWKIVRKQRMSAISYVATGGFSKPQLYPHMALPLMKIVDKVCDLMPFFFATRFLAVLEKEDSDS